MNFLARALALLLFCVFCSAQTVHRLAEQRNVIFDRIGTEDGLSQGLVTTFAQDSRGFIWIGTQEGLNRFDGFDFETYDHIEGDDSSLSHDSIWTLRFDSQDRFWIGTDAGLNLYDSYSRSFSLFPLNFKSSTQQPEIYALLEDSVGRIWVGTSNGLALLETDSSEVILETVGVESTQWGSIRALAIDSSGLLYVGTERSGVQVLDTRNMIWQQEVYGFDSRDIADDLHIRDLLIDLTGAMWVGSYNGGLTRIDPVARTVSKFSSDARTKGALGSNRIRTLFEDQRGDIWVGTDNGLHVWLKGTQQFIRYELDLTNPRSISNNDIHDIFQDEGGVIWVGTFDGLSKWNANVDMFPYFKRPSNAQGSVPGNNVNSFTSGNGGDVWIGTFSGLMLWDASTAELKSLSSEDIPLTDSRVMSLGRNGEDIWVGTMAGGINIVRGYAVVDVLKFDLFDDNSISGNAITKIYKDHLGRSWVGTWGAGVNLYLGDGRFRRFPNQENPSGRFSDLRCMDILQVRNGDVWIATDGGGIVILDAMTSNTSVLSNDPEDVTSLVSDNVLTLLETDSGVWIGTVDRGLNYFDYETREILRYSKKDGLASDAIFGLLQDGAGKIWISGGRGLTVFDPKRNEFRQFDSSHGLQSSDFNSGAYAKLDDGSLVFGGNNGFNAFYPENITLNRHVPKIQITSISLFNEPLYLGRQISDLKQIELAYNESVIGFEFASLDYTAPKKNQYRHKLEGFDRDWVHHKGNREVTYTNLDSGNYQFRVQGSNNDGVWNEQGASIELVVEPAPWLTWWAYCLYIILITMLFYVLFRLNSDRLQREAERRYSERLQLYIESLEEASDSILIADSAGALMYANNTIMKGLNKTPSEMIGKSIWNVLFEKDADIESARKKLVSEGRYHGEVVLAGQAGEPVTHEITIAAVQQSSSNKQAYVGISRDVTERKVAEAQLADYRKNLEHLVEERTEALQKEIAENKAIQVHLADSLQEKELLIKEVHHRVKNNMQVISSLLSIQAEGAGDEVYSNLLNESQQRIKSMALIHETLYQSKDLLKIDFQDYIDSLTSSLSRSYIVPGVSVHVDVNVENVLLDLETAVPCGLVINELVSNALKHAFKGKNGTGVISIDFVTTDCNYDLTISDNGIGLPPGFDLNKNTSMGMEIVTILTAQLEGRLTACSDNGAVFHIQFPRSGHV